MWRIGFFVALFVALVEAVLLAVRLSGDGTAATLGGITASREEIPGTPAVTTIDSPPQQSLHRTVVPEQQSATVERLLELKRHQLIRLDVPLLDPEGVMNPAIAELLGLSAGQHRAIASVIGQTKGAVQSLIEANTTVSKTPEGTIEVTQTGSDDGRLHDELLTAVRQAIGDDKYNLFLSIVGDSIETSFDHFGAKDRVIRISPMRSVGGETYFQIEERYKLGKNTGSTSSQVRDKNMLRRILGSHTDQVLEKL